jgi:cytochrome d ubiquinol oxidase subunit I
MDAVLLARIQFALTVGFHFIFPPLTIGLAWIIFWFMNRYRKTGDEAYGAQARFWMKLFAVTFAVGVATGITMEFQFGTNWADYSRFVGDIFGAPLAAEGILAFFLESTFMGVFLFGWHRFSKRVLWTASLLVAVGSTLSAFWIIVANSWMQTPAGYEIVNGKAVLTDFMAAVFNPSTIPRYLHTMVACLITGSFFMMSVSAWYILKGQHLDFAKRSLMVSLAIGFISASGQLPVGHYHAVQVANTQPAKLAAVEGLFETQRRAPALLFGIPDGEQRKVHAAVEVPAALSILVDLDPEREIQGLGDFPTDEWPPLGLTFYPFHLMFFLGMYFIGLTTFGLFLYWKKKIFDNKLFLKLAVISLPLPIITNELGWIVAEVGRQPWIVYQVPGMRTADAVSKAVSAGEILASIILFSIIYTLLFVLWVHLLRRHIRKGPEALTGSDRSAGEVAA